MGLTICKHIVERSGGTIEQISLGENQGTTIVLSMNMQIAGKIDDQMKREDEEQESMEEMSGEQGVADQASILQMLEKIQIDPEDGNESCRANILDVNEE